MQRLSVPVLNKPVAWFVLGYTSLVLENHLHIAFPCPCIRDEHEYDLLATFKSKRLG
jgi:hypothetical protein